jgi:hypothetical protein
LHATTVAAVRTRDGRIVRFRVVRGSFGVPQVAFDGTTDGLTADGRRLVLTSAMGGPAPARTTFVVLRTSSLRPQNTIALRGLWAFDAISPDGRTIYALQYGSGDHTGNAIWRVKLRVPDGGRVVALHDGSRGTLATIDFTTRAVRSVRAPRDT